VCRSSYGVNFSMPARWCAHRTDEQDPCLQPVVFALDTIVPVIDFGQADQWTVSRSPDWAWTLAAFIWVAIAVGWFFGILLVAGAGGLVRQV